jgi:hypothetical protein
MKPDGSAIEETMQAKEAPMLSVPGYVHLSIVVPFDIGCSFVCKSLDGNDREAWKRIFPTSDAIRGWEWNTSRLGKAPTYYREPFGKVARLEAKESAIFDSFRPCFSSVSDLQAIFFPRGIGVLLLRGKIEGCRESWRGNYKKYRNDMKKLLAPHLEAVVNDFRRIMRSAAKNPCEREVFQIKLPGKVRSTEVNFPYAIAFFEEEAGGYSEKFFSYPGEDFALEVDWGETAALNVSNLAATQALVEDAFVAAMVSWFSLVIMGNKVSYFLRDLFIDLTLQERSLSKQDGEMVQLAYLDTSSASRPISWAFRKADLLLLEHIHEKWGSQRFWDNVEERTALFAAYHNDIVEEVRDESDRNLARVGIGLAAVTLLSVIADFSAACFLTRVVMAMTAIAGLIVAYIFTRGRKGRKN